MLTTIIRKRNALERYLSTNNLQKCVELLSQSKGFFSNMPIMCEQLQEELIETLFDIVDYPEEREQTINYLQQQIDMYTVRLNELKQRYNRLIYHIGDKRKLTKEGRQEENYSPQIMQQNLQYQDLKWELSSYIEGYHYDRNEYRKWLLNLLQANL